MKTKPSRAAKARRVDEQEGARGGQGGARASVGGVTGPGMYQFSDRLPATKPELYRDLLAALDALTADEPDAIANMANAAALLWEYLPDLNWAGFYRHGRRRAGARAVPGQGGVHPHPARQGRVRHGGGDAARRSCVDDVHAFPGHIACDAASRSELVVPIVREGAVIGVLDLDSPMPARFDAEDVAGCEAIAAVLGSRI